jgi:hypothetical protein
MKSATDNVFRDVVSENANSHTTSCFWGAKDPVSVKDTIESLVEEQFGSKDGVFAGDGLITIGRNLSFLTDEKFMRAFRDVISDENYVGQGIIWRLYTFCWAAKSCLNKQGDFVECGVSIATSSKIMCRYLSFQDVPKKLYLYDLFGIDAGMDLSAYFGSRSSTEVLSEVRANFAPYPNVHAIPGFIPHSFEGTAPESIAFLHIDLNNVALFDRVSPGGIILFDDYGFSGFVAQKMAEDSWLSHRGYTVCELPTGQGLVIK